MRLLRIFYLIFTVLLLLLQVVVTLLTVLLLTGIHNMKLKSNGGIVRVSYLGAGIFIAVAGGIYAGNNYNILDTPPASNSTASALATTGTAVTVSGAAPPTTGEVL